MRAARRSTCVGHRLTVTLLAAALAGCSSAVTDPGPGPTTTAPPSPTTPAGPRTGITAEPLSTALPIQARDLRLVRVGANELALQFEFANGADRPITPDTLGIDQYERVLMLVDLPRSTSYEILDAQGNDGRISASNGDQVPPGGAVTVTAVFAAPPDETTGLTAFIDGFLPVAVPVQPVGGAPQGADGVVAAPGSDAVSALASDGRVAWPGSTMLRSAPGSARVR